MEVVGDAISLMEDGWVGSPSKKTTTLLDRV